MATSWSVSAASNGELVHNLPELPSDDIETVERVKWWNDALKKNGVEREVLGVARHELKLSLV